MRWEKRKDFVAKFCSYDKAFDIIKNKFLDIMKDNITKNKNA